MQNNQSEIAHILHTIDLQFEAAVRGMQSPAMVASHDFIVARTHVELARFVGTEEASKIIFEHYLKNVEPQ